jgi:apoptosis-inducing factor 2
VPVAAQFAPYPSGSFRFIHARATALDHANRTVTVRAIGPDSPDPETLAYHALVLATGAATPSPLMGLNAGDAAALRSTWGAFRAALPAAKHIVILGGGPTGVETAGELGEYLNGRAGWGRARLENPKVAITLVTSGAALLPVLRPGLAKKAEDLLAKVGVKVVKNARVASVSPENAGRDGHVADKATVTLENGEVLEADLYIPSPGITPNADFVDASLRTEDGRVETNPETLRVDKAGPRVYAVGDVASYARPACHLIFEAIPVLGANIKRDLLLAAGKDGSAVVADRTYKVDTSETQLVPIGQSKGVGSAKGYALPSFLVWLIKGRDYWLWTTGSLWSGKQWAKEA